MSHIATSLKKRNSISFHNRIPFISLSFLYFFTCTVFNANGCNLGEHIQSRTGEPYTVMETLTDQELLGFKLLYKNPSESIAWMNEVTRRMPLYAETNNIEAMEKVLKYILSLFCYSGSIKSKEDHCLFFNTFSFFVLDWENYFSYCDPEKISPSFLAEILHTFSFLNHVTILNLGRYVELFIINIDQFDILSLQNILESFKRLDLHKSKGYEMQYNLLREKYTLLREKYTELSRQKTVRASLRPRGIVERKKS